MLDMHIWWTFANTGMKVVAWLPNWYEKIAPRNSAKTDYIAMSVMTDKTICIGRFLLTFMHEGNTISHTKKICDTSAAQNVSHVSFISRKISTRNPSHGKSPEQYILCYTHTHNHQTQW